MRQQHMHIEDEPIIWEHRRMEKVREPTSKYVGTMGAGQRGILAASH
jgi:hypothetical protein